MADSWAYGLYGEIAFTCACGQTVEAVRDEIDSNGSDGLAMRCAAAIWERIVCPACGRCYQIGLVVTQYEPAEPVYHLEATCDA